ncbi:MAG: PaaI family thioesterase [Pseudomonadota bacterium]|nr:PaaI family thioesterase [Pseudomonadota bacterium]
MLERMDGPERVRAALMAQGFMRLVGAEIDEVTAGRVVLGLDWRPEVAQQHGLFHGGVVAFLIDNATTAAAGTVLREGQACLTAEYKVNLLSGASSGRLQCVAEVLKPGRSLSVVEARVWGEIGGQRKLVATGTATIAVIAAPAPPEAA